MAVKCGDQGDIKLLLEGEIKVAAISKVRVDEGSPLIPKNPAEKRIG